MQNVRIAIGRRIKRLRELQGLSRQQIADRLQIDLTAAAAWEAGKYLPREGRRVRLAELFVTDVGTLFAEEQHPAPARQASLIDPLSELPGVLREAAAGAAQRIRIFRLNAPHPTRPFALEEFRRIADTRLADGLAVDTVETVFTLDRLKEILSNLLRYRDTPYRVRLAGAGDGSVVPAMGGYLIDDDQVVLGGYWGAAPADGRLLLRLYGEPYRRYFGDYWAQIWTQATPLNPEGAPALDAVAAAAERLGLPCREWEAFLASAMALRLADGLPPLL